MQKSSGRIKTEVMKSSSIEAINGDLASVVSSAKRYKGHHLAREVDALQISLSERSDNSLSNNELSGHPYFVLIGGEVSTS